MGTYPPAISMPYYEIDVTFNNSGGNTTVYVQGGPSDVTSLATAVSDAISELDTVASVTSNLWSEAEINSYTAPTVVVSPEPNTIQMFISPGNSDTFNVSLSSAPEADVTVTVSVTDTTDSPSLAEYVTATPSSVTFTPENWNTAQGVVLGVSASAPAEHAHVHVDFNLTGQESGPYTYITFTSN